MRAQSSVAPRPERPATNSSNSGRQKVFCTSTSSSALRRSSRAAGRSPCASAQARASSARC